MFVFKKKTQNNNNFLKCNLVLLFGLNHTMDD